MISKSVQHNLRANLSRIAALCPGRMKTASCLYIYNDESVCAASACLTDEMRDQIEKAHLNNKSIDRVVHDLFYHLDDYRNSLHDMTTLQAAHDDYLKCRFYIENNIPGWGPETLRRRKTAFIIELCRMLDTRLEEE